MSEKFYITTAIAYPNGKPHMGHALEIIQADTFARFYRLLGKNVIFQTGTDEHGIKNRQTAKNEGKDIYEFLNNNVDTFKKLYNELGISYTHFIRTSDKELHYPGAQKLWNKLIDNEDIYLKKYKGLYCEGCESFKTEKELIKNKEGKIICKDHPNKNIQEIEEENYFFKLSKYKKEIIDSIKNNIYQIQPEKRKNEILNFLEDAQDISFSRQKENLPWGIPVPNDPNHVMYVWCDALSNYITGQGYENDENNFNQIRPADMHIIGKDILRFHAAFWPAMLISGQLQLPKKLIVHGFVTMNGAKMGKSTGNIIDPIEILNKFPRDAFIFNLLYDISIGSDGDFSIDRLENIYNSMLIGGWGNLISRVTKLSHKNSINKGVFDKDLWKIFNLENNKLSTLFEGGENNIEQDYLKNININGYLQDWYQIVNKANEFMQIQEPWTKIKNPETEQEGIKILKFMIYLIKNLAILSSPFLKDGFEKIKKILGNKELNNIDTSKNIDFEITKKCLQMETFQVELKPNIIYKKIENE